MNRESLINALTFLDPHVVPSACQSVMKLAATALAAHFKCEGCGHLAEDPDRDLAAFRVAGAQSCCPERRMVRQATAGEAVS